MDDLLSKVMDLQPAWQAKNSVPMQRRGVLVRTDMPNWLREHHEAIAEAMGVPLEDVGILGRDGAGQKTEVAWARVHSKVRSPSATLGWYVVYLFDMSGDKVYLSLNQGTTKWNGGELKPRDPSELRRRNDWARPVIQEQASTRTDLVTAISLGARGPLGQGYESGNVIAIEYRRDALPTPEVLTSDLLFMTRLLGTVYKAEQATAHLPGDVAVEVREAQESADTTAGRRKSRRSGQGFLLTAGERRAIELRAVLLATEHFQAEGWSVKDVGATQSYDLKLSRGEERLHVEVKGTTSEGTQVILTRSEVERQRELAPHNALVVVHSINLDRSTEPPSATGGVLHCTSPWIIEDDSLTVISYVHTTGL
ncbi:MrcB family domain-containing protein [Streptomyces sp. NPDC059533]|uniref:MrcB family domain-containing protein n=1 Tax=unclassified Streptomyces TaxID=2593676 RepID=UPI0036C0270B